MFAIAIAVMVAVVIVLVVAAFVIAIVTRTTAPGPRSCAVVVIVAQRLLLTAGWWRHQCRLRERGIVPRWPVVLGRPGCRRCPSRLFGIITRAQAVFGEHVALVTATLLVVGAAGVATAAAIAVAVALNLERDPPTARRG